MSICRALRGTHILLLQGRSIHRALLRHDHRLHTVYSIQCGLSATRNGRTLDYKSKSNCRSLPDNNNSPPRLLVMMRGYFTWIMLYALSLSSCLVHATSNNIVDLGYASYRGNLSYPNVVAYLGIPYAEPPLGDWRFRAPVPLNTTRVAEEAGGNVIDATTYPNFCIQGTTGGTYHVTFIQASIDN